MLVRNSHIGVITFFNEKQPLLLKSNNFSEESETKSKELL
jgi:hypothetical protein